MILKPSNMKTLMTILFTILFGMVNGQMAFVKMKVKVEHQCEICGKWIYTFEEQKDRGIYPFYDDGMYGGFGSFNYDEYGTPDSLKAESFKIAYSINYICPACLKKYSSSIKEKIGLEWNTYWDKAKKDNVKTVVKYNEIKKNERIKALNDQIELLKKQKECIKKGMDKDCWDTISRYTLTSKYWMRSVDTLTIRSDTTIKLH